MSYIINTWINKFALDLYDNSGNSYRIIIFFIAFTLLICTLLILFRKKIYILFYINLFALLFILSAIIFLYNRGYRLNDIRDNGYLLLSYIEKFNKINNRYAYDIDEVYTFISLRSNKDIARIKRTKNSYQNLFKIPEDKNNFNFYLSIHDDIPGFEYFSYRIDPVRFELTDD